jgi:N-acetylglutamate synthase-like GNAT family acetyltransferase
MIEGYINNYKQSENQIKFEKYNDNLHRTQTYKMLLEYCNWLNTEIFTKYGIHFFAGGDTKLATERIFSRFIDAKPPQGNIILLIINKKAVGMCRLKKLSDKIGEINYLYIHPKFRGRGFSYKMLESVEKEARNLGCIKLYLHTNKFNNIANNLFKKVGFKERARYMRYDLLKYEITQLYDEEKMYFSKILDFP